MANFADLLKKIANNSRLTPQELDELGRFGTDTQQRNALVSGTFQNQEVISVKNLRAVSIEADFVSTLGCRVVMNTGQTITNASGTLIIFNREVFDDDSMIDISANNDRISINTSGRWLLVNSCTYSDTGSDIRTLQAILYSSSGAVLGGIVDSAAVRFNSASDLVYLEKGQYIRFMVRQDSGSSKTLLRASVTLILMRKTDIGDD